MCVALRTGWVGKESMTNRECTIGKDISLEGIGLHSGRPARMTLRPARPGTGIVFVRADLPSRPRIEARFDQVSGTTLATTLGTGDVRVATTEHLLSAFYGMGIDNATVELTSAELPIMDGSSRDFVTAIEAAGIHEQLEHRRLVKLKRSVQVFLGDKWAVAEPSARFQVHTRVSFPHPAIGEQELSFEDGRDSFRDIASARTFGFAHEVEHLRKNGLALGGSLENAVVFSPTGVMNPEGLRFPDEVVRHKMLDALGDFMLAGIRFEAAFVLNKSGHDLHQKLLAAIFENSANYAIVDSRPAALQPRVSALTAVS